MVLWFPLGGFGNVEFDELVGIGIGAVIGVVRIMNDNDSHRARVNSPSIDYRVPASPFTNPGDPTSPDYYKGKSIQQILDEIEKRKRDGRPGQTATTAPSTGSATKPK